MNISRDLQHVPLPYAPGNLGMRMTVFIFYLSRRKFTLMRRNGGFAVSCPYVVDGTADLDLLYCPALREFSLL